MQFAPLSELLCRILESSTKASFRTHMILSPRLRPTILGSLDIKVLLYLCQLNFRWPLSCWRGTLKIFPRMETGTSMVGRRWRGIHHMLATVWGNKHQVRARGIILEEGVFLRGAWTRQKGSTFDIRWR